MTGGSIAYCGLPPTPATLMAAWNLDPVLLAGLGLVAWLIARHAVRPLSAWAAWGLAVALFVSPLCNLTSALFSVRVLHHVLLAVAVAPLLVRGFALERRVAGGGTAAAVLHGALMWLWHAPVAYSWALSSVPGYWLMQLTLLASGVWLWAVILGPARGPSLAAAAISLVQMGMLGAVILLAPQPLYAAHLFTTEPFGLSALADQQLAGAIMWIPAAGPYMAAILWGVMSLLGPATSSEAGR